MGLVSRHAESAWRVPPDLARRIEQHAANATPRHDLAVKKVPIELRAQLRHEGPVWLDRVHLKNLAPYGFGAELRRLVEQRREGLRRAGIRHEDPDRMAKLEEVERRAVGRRAPSAPASGSSRCRRLAFRDVSRFWTGATGLRPTRS
jgi:hypothetical protein